MACENIYKKTGKSKINSGQSSDRVKPNSKQSFSNHGHCGGGANSAFEATISPVVEKIFAIDQQVAVKCNQYWHLEE